MNWKLLFWWVPFGSVPEISPTDLNVSLSGKNAPFVIDVRTPQEWQSSRIKGSVNIPITSLRREIANLSVPTDKPVVAICLTAHRSIPAVRLFNALGYTDVRQLQGGMQAWWKAALPVVENK
jgi:rhodanese-related sulfurtransferase